MASNSEDFSSITLSDLLSSPLAEFISEESTSNSSKKARLLFDSDERRECERLRDKNINSNTVRTTNTWVSRFETWRISRGLEQSLQDTPRDELDDVLQHFYACVKKQDGEDYEPGSLRTMLASLDRFLREKGKHFSIQRDREFEKSRKVLNGKAIELRENGKGNRPHRAHALADKEVELLWQRVFGTHSAQSLNYTVYFVVSQHFGTRGCQEHHQIVLEDLKWVKDSETGSTVYIEWVEGITKTRKGGLQKADRELTQRMFATGGPRCPVSFLEFMISKRPPELQHSGQLYLRPLTKPQTKVWYSKQPVGVNTINGYNIAEIAKIGNTGKNITNHSSRKTLVKKLKKAGVDGRNIKAITGHRSEESLKDYDENDIEDHCKLSSIIAGTSCATMATTPTPTVTTTTQTPTDTAPCGYHSTHPLPPYPYYPPYASTDFNFSYNQQVSHYYPPFPPVSSAPQYHFSNCSVYFDHSSKQ